MTLLRRLLAALKPEPALPPTPPLPIREGQEVWGAQLDRVPGGWRPIGPDESPFEALRTPGAVLTGPGLRNGTVGASPAVSFLSGEAD